MSDVTVPSVTVPEVSAIPEVTPAVDGNIVQAAAEAPAPKVKKARTAPVRPKTEYANWISTSYKDKGDEYVEVALSTNAATGEATLRCVAKSGKVVESKFKFTSVTSV